MAARHRIGGRQLGRNSGQRRALYRSLLIALVTHDRIRTTEAKAKEIQPMVEKLITLGAHGHAAPRATRRSPSWRTRPRSRGCSRRSAPRFAGRPGGYTRIFKINTRPGDGAVVARSKWWTKTWRVLAGRRSRLTPRVWPDRALQINTRI